MVIEDELVRLAGLRAAGKARRAFVGAGRNRAAGENTVEVLDARAGLFRRGVKQGCRATFGRTSAAFERDRRTRPRRPTRAARPSARPSSGAVRGMPIGVFMPPSALKKMRAACSRAISDATRLAMRRRSMRWTRACAWARHHHGPGLGVVEPDVRQLAFVGDSTFFVSGLTGIANAAKRSRHHGVRARQFDHGHDGRPAHPGTGRTLIPQAEALSIEASLKALGVTCIEHANPHRLDESIEAVTRAVEHRGFGGRTRAPCVDLRKRRRSEHRCRCVHGMQEAHHLDRLPRDRSMGRSPRSMRRCASAAACA
ncbi:MAG: hypothetical protein ACLT98_12975 [Eggerthellaceae bacterium]